MDVKLSQVYRERWSDDGIAHCFIRKAEEPFWQCCLSLTQFGPAKPFHDDVIKWKHFPRYWPFVRGIHWSPVNSLHEGQ